MEKMSQLGWCAGMWPSWWGRCLSSCWGLSFCGRGSPVPPLLQAEIIWSTQSPEQVSRASLLLEVLLRLSQLPPALQNLAFRQKCPKFVSAEGLVPGAGVTPCCSVSFGVTSRLSAAQPAAMPREAALVDY